jgi:hypothetical protein
MCKIISYHNWIWIIDCMEIKPWRIKWLLITSASFEYFLCQEMWKEKMNEVLYFGSNLQLKNSFANFDFKANEPSTLSLQVLG